MTATTQQNAPPDERKPFWADKLKSKPDPEMPQPVLPPKKYTQYELDFMEQSRHYYDSGRD